MLTNDEIYQSRDVSTAEMVAVMMELKYFDEQFLYYGLAYAEDGVIKYRLNDNPLPLCRFWADCTQKGLYPTGLTQHVQLAKVPSGQEAIIAAQVRQTFVDKLKGLYPKSLFQALTLLGQTAATNAAQDLLDLWQDELELCFIPERISCFAGLCQMAYEAKLLTEPVFQALSQWSRQRSEQIHNCENVIWHDKRYFYGFMYWQGGQAHIYSNAELPLVLSHAYSLQATGLPCTPMRRKYYWFDAHPSWSIAAWREQFETDLLHLYDADYLQRFQALRALPPALSPRRFAAACSSVDTTIYPQAAQVLGYYQNRWLHESK